MDASKWFIRINTLENARQAIQNAHRIALTLAGIQATIIIGLSIIEPSLAINIVDPICLAALGYALWQKPTRIAAFLLFAYAWFIVYITVGNKAGTTALTTPGGENVILALVMAYAGYQALVGTFKYHEFSESTVDTRALFQMIFLILAYFIAGLSIGLAPTLVPPLVPLLNQLPDPVLSLLLLGPSFLAAYLAALGILPMTRNKKVVHIPPDTDPGHHATGGY